jgi:hypothetical protein
MTRTVVRMLATDRAATPQASALSAAARERCWRASSAGDPASTSRVKMAVHVQEAGSNEYTSAGFEKRPNRHSEWTK